jgi:hypothetical protein
VPPVHIMAVRRGAPVCLAAALVLGFACTKSDDGGDAESSASGESSKPSGPKPIERGEPETLSGHMYLRMTNKLGIDDTPETPTPFSLAVDGNTYYLPLFYKIMVIEPGASKPRFISVPEGTWARGLHKDEIIVQDKERGAVLAIPKAGGEVRTVAAQGLNEIGYLVGDRLVAIAPDSVLSHVPIAGGQVETQLGQVGAEVLTDMVIRGDAILWAAHKERSMILVARGSFETIEVAHELADANVRITGVAWLGDDIVYAVGEPDMAFFHKKGDTVERLAIELRGDPVMWSDDNSAWWALRVDEKVIEAGRIGPDGFHELLNLPPDLFPSPAGTTWSAKHEGVTNYYVNRPASEGAVPLSLDLADLQPLNRSFADHYKGPEPKVEVVIAEGTAKLFPKILESQQKFTSEQAMHCYKGALIRDPSLAGELEVELHIEPGERTQKVVKATPMGEVGNAELTKCIAESTVGGPTLLTDDKGSGTVRATFKLSVPTG